MRVSRLTFGSKAMLPIRLRRITSVIEAMRRPVAYLEIGVRKGDTFFNVPASTHVGVDPHPDFDDLSMPDGFEFFQMPSDLFFEDHVGSRTFDLVFIDGLHEWKQTYRDLVNSLRVLREGGLIVLDDVLPIDWFSAQPEVRILDEARTRGLVAHECWYGDVYKVVKVIAEQHPELEFMTLGNRNPRVHASTFIWKKPNSDSSVPRLAESYVEEIDALDFYEIFPSTKIPHWYRRGVELPITYQRMIKRASYLPR